MKKILALSVLCCLAANSLTAKDDTTPPVTAEVLPGWVQADGSHMAALRLTLAPGWKTYWRAPGDAGIPPRFDWSGSKNLARVAVSWPTPKVFDQNGMRSVGYESVLVIPLRIHPVEHSTAVQLSVDMDLGVCSDICVPYALSLDAEIDSSSQKPVPAIAAALAQQPYSAEEAGVRSAECIVSPTADGLKIEARVTMPPAGDDEYVVIEPGPGDIWVSEAKTQRSGGSLIALSELVNVNGGPIALDRSAIRITVLGSKHAVDIRGCSPG